MRPTIIYEDPDIVVLDKPAGLLTHAKHSKDDSETLVSWFKQNYPELSILQEPDIEDGIERTGIVHRLDRETSGLIILGKTKNAVEDLKNKFKNREIKKTYLALVYGQLKEKQGIIDAPLGRLGIQQSTRIHGTHELESRTAITQYRVIESFHEYSLLEVKPETGRTHQIRVHLKSTGHPIVCDRIYASRRQSCPAGLGRLFLHAAQIVFTSPSGKALSFELGLPKELENFLDQLREDLRKSGK